MGAGEETRCYTYNVENMLTEVRQTSDGSTNEYVVTYEYDALGRRVQEAVTTGGSTVTTRYAYNAEGQVWAETNASNAVQGRYLYGVGENAVLERTDVSAGVQWLLTDDMGNVRDVASSTAVEDHIEYDGVGQVVSQTDATAYAGTRFFNGEFQNLYTDTLHANDRDEDLAVDQWYQQDPSMFNGGSSNLRQIDGNDAINAIDPSGLEKELKKLLTISLSSKKFFIEPAVYQNIELLQFLYGIEYSIIQIHREDTFNRPAELYFLPQTGKDSSDEIARAAFVAERKDLAIKYNKLLFDLLSGAPGLYRALVGETKQPAVGAVPQLGPADGPALAAPPEYGAPMLDFSAPSMIPPMALDSRPQSLFPGSASVNLGGHQLTVQNGAGGLSFNLVGHPAFIGVTPPNLGAMSDLIKNWENDFSKVDPKQAKEIMGMRFGIKW